MPAQARTCTLGAVIAELGSDAALLSSDAQISTRPVTGASLWSGAGSPRPDSTVVLVCHRVTGTDDLRSLFAQLPPTPSRIIALSIPSTMARTQIATLAGDHAVIVLPDTRDQADVVLAIAHATETPDDTISRRLSSLQRSLTMALSESDPIPALVTKLKSLCNATIALVDKNGGTLHATGPLPMTLLMAEITSTTAASQSVQVDGWHGLADRVSDPTQGGDHFGWLVAAARRPDFPDAYSAAAIHVATTLVETSQRMTRVAARQERAIRSAVLEEAIALDRRPRAPELAGRLASFGLSFGDELRVMVCQPAAAHRPARAMAQIEEQVPRALTRNAIPHIISMRDGYAAVLLQSTPASLRRLLVAEQDTLPEMRVGIGRTVAQISDVANSFHDAQLALRAVTRGHGQNRAMSYDDFDFATRLFSDVGLDSMLAWAERLLAPLDPDGPLLESLQVYFDQNQNINAAAELLHVHHNSLRYRLAKVEELLRISLRDPAAVSSVYLALAAVDLSVLQARTRRDLSASSRPSDIEAPGAPTEISGRPVEPRGVVLDPEP